MIPKAENYGPLVFAIVLYVSKFSNMGRNNVKKKINKVNETVN